MNIEKLSLLKKILDREIIVEVFEEENIICLDYGVIPKDLEECFLISKMLEQFLESDILFRFVGFDIMMNKDATYEDIEKQYKMQSRIKNELFVKSLCDDLLKEQDLEKFVRKLKQFEKSDRYKMIKVCGFIPKNFESEVFQKLYDGYRLEAPNYGKYNRTFSKQKMKIKKIGD